MCIIVDKKKGYSIDWGLLDDCNLSNPDGIGFMLYNPRTRMIDYKKGFFLIEELEDYLLSKYDEDFLKNTDIAFHFRIATHGKINEFFCHPFVIDNIKIDDIEGSVKSAVMHNGIISITADDVDVSDTYLFTKEYLTKFKRYFDDKQIQQVIGNLIDTSKLLIYSIDSKGKFKKYFINRQYFVNDKDYIGYTFSNTSYIPMYKNWNFKNSKGVFI